MEIFVNLCMVEEIRWEELGFSDKYNNVFKNKESGSYNKQRRELFKKTTAINQMVEAPKGPTIVNKCL